MVGCVLVIELNTVFFSATRKNSINSI